MDKINYYLLFVITITLCVITLGAYVRLSHAGLGCPDWPGCYGYLVGVPDSSLEITAAESIYEGSIVDIMKAWKEMIHRYLAGSLGVFIFIISFIFYKKSSYNLFKFSFFITLLVIFQAILGIVLLHLVGGLTIISLLWLLFLRYNNNSFFEKNSSYSKTKISKKEIKGLSILSYVALFFLTMQIVLGGWTSTNYAALACVDFPKCNTSWWPQMDFYNAFFVELATNLNYEFGRLDSPARVAIHFTHRIWAIFTTLVIIILAFKSYKLLKDPYQKFLSLTLVLLLFFQVLLGILNVKMSLPIYIAVSHNGNAALLLICLVTQLYSIHITKKII